MNAPVFLQSVIGDYRLVDFLGAGGMGEVYRAVHIKIGRVAAVKILTRTFHSPTLAERFRNEARIHARLHHPNIAAFYDYRQVSGRPCILMEYVDGQTLADRIRITGPIPPAEALRIFRAVVAAMAYMHGQNILHRDLKPNNIKIRSNSEVKLLDFGIAKILSEPSLTQTGDVVGTLQYLSPEQMEGHPADARSDIWSLGVVLYEMVTGKTPFEAKTAGELYKKIVKGSYAPPSVLNIALPKPLEAIIAGCLCKKPAHRYASAEELLAALPSPEGSSGEPVAQAAVNERPATGDKVAADRWAKYRMSALLAAVTIVLLLVIRFWPSPSQVSSAISPAASVVVSPPSIKGSAGPIKPVRIDVFEERAAVYYQDQIIAHTPYEFNAHQGERIEFVLKREGYLDRPIQFEVNGSRNVYVYTMEKIKK